LTPYKKFRQNLKSLAAENMLLRQQLITIRRKYKRSPKIETSDRILYGFLSAWINSKRLSKIAIIIKPVTILKFHKALVKRKYQLLFSSKSPKKLGRKGPSEKLVKLIVEMKARNPRFGYLRMAMQIQHSFGLKLDIGVIKRVRRKF
jgi:putative transposase